MERVRLEAGRPGRRLLHPARRDTMEAWAGRVRCVCWGDGRQPGTEPTLLCTDPSRSPHPAGDSMALRIGRD